MKQVDSGAQGGRRECGTRNARSGGLRHGGRGPHQMIQETKGTLTTEGFGLFMGRDLSEEFAVKWRSPSALSDATADDVRDVEIMQG